RPADAKLADALAVERTAVRIGFVEKHDVQRADVGVHCDMIAGQILVDEGAIARVDMVLFDQRGANPPRHASDHLGACCLRIQDATDREHAEHSSNAYLPRVAIDADFDKMRADVGMRVSLVEVGGSVRSLGFLNSERQPLPELSTGSK